MAQNENLNLRPLKKALDRLEEIMAVEADAFIRDGAIQRFEYSFELAWKATQRFLKLEGLSTGSPKEVFRAAFQRGLIPNIDQWFSFLKSRNLTVHVYNEDSAEEVYESIGAFLESAKDLLQKLEDMSS